MSILRAVLGRVLVTPEGETNRKTLEVIEAMADEIDELKDEVAALKKAVAAKPKKAAAPKKKKAKASAA